MDAAAEKTLLALLLALTDPQVTLSDLEQLDLEEAGKSLESHPDTWAVIEEDLMAVIEGNAALNQAYQTAKKQLDVLGSDIPSDLRPTKAELQQALTIDSDVEQRRAQSGKNYQSDSQEIISYIAVPVLKKPAAAQKVSFIERIKTFSNNLSSTETWQYLVERPHPWRRQLYIKGRKLLASTVWRDMIANDMSPEEAADNWDLPLEAIHEAIRYCESHQELLKQEAEEERYRLEQKGVSLEPATAP